MGWEGLPFILQDLFGGASLYPSGCVWVRSPEEKVERGTALQQLACSLWDVVDNNVEFHPMPIRPRATEATGEQDPENGPWGSTERVGL